MSITGWRNDPQERIYEARAKAADRARYPGPFRQIGNIWRAKTGRSDPRTERMR
jgi:hypothetical protein